MPSRLRRDPAKPRTASKLSTSRNSWSVPSTSTPRARAVPAPMTPRPARSAPDPRSLLAGPLTALFASAERTVVPEPAVQSGLLRFGAVGLAAAIQVRPGRYGLGGPFGRGAGGHT